MTDTRTRVGLFSVRDLNKDLAIGVDIGGTKIYGVLINSKGKIIKNVKINTEPEKSKKTIINNIIKVINELIDNKVTGIGIGIPGIVDNKGKLIWLPNVTRLNGVNLKEILEKKFLVEVKIENDANCFALSEVKYGAAKGYNNVLGIVLGTGIGSGIIIGGKIYSGNGSAGEIGHIKIFNNLEFEKVCGGKALEKEYKKIPKEIFKNSKIRNEWIKNLAKGFAVIVNILNPEIVVVGGGLAQGIDFTLLNKEVKKLVIPTCNVKIVCAKVGYESGVLGAASLHL